MDSSKKLIGKNQIMRECESKLLDDNTKLDWIVNFIQNPLKILKERLIQTKVDLIK